MKYTEAEVWSHNRQLYLSHLCISSQCASNIMLTQSRICEAEGKFRKLYNPAVCIRSHGPTPVISFALPMVSLCVCCMRCPEVLAVLMGEIRVRTYTQSQSKSLRFLKFFNVFFPITIYPPYTLLPPALTTPLSMSMSAFSF